MIAVIISGTKELETDSPRAAGKAVQEWLKGMKDATVRIIVEERKGKEKYEATD